ncbi:MAG TPA: hypothetical protein VGN69_04275 [Solirubrobacteraceae bacterium]|nr:hypothetical protein [Solirubrobacteraceae bacterium]
MAALHLWQLVYTDPTDGAGLGSLADVLSWTIAIGGVYGALRLLVRIFFYRPRPRDTHYIPTEAPPPGTAPAPPPPPGP